MTSYIFRVAGPRQVYLDRGIHRHDIVVLGDHGRVVHVIDRVAFDRDVVIEEVIEGLISHREGKDGLSWVDFFPSIRDNPVLNQMCQGGIEHFGMNAEILTVQERFADPAGYSTHADLEAGM